MLSTATMSTGVGSFLCRSYSLRHYVIPGVMGRFNRGWAPIRDSGVGLFFLSNGFFLEGPMRLVSAVSSSSLLEGGVSAFALAL